VKTILLIDDDMHFSDLMAEVLTRRGYRVLHARGGREATHVVGVEQVELVMVDGLLPDTDGITWIAGLRASHHDLPVVFVSSFWRDLASFQRLTNDLGVSLVVPKPVVPSALADQIDSLLGRVRPSPTRSAEFREAMALMRANFALELPAKVRRLSQAVIRARRSPASAFLVEEARGHAHRLRGTAGTYGFREVGERAGEAEDAIISAGQAPQEEDRWTTVDAAVERLGEACHHADQPAAVPRPGYVPMAAATTRVLVVDSDPRFREQAAEVGRQQLLAVTTAADAATALAAAHASPPDAAILAVNLGDDDAFLLARSLRALPGLRDLTLAFVAAEDRVRDRVAATHAGASLFLAKPIEGDALGVAIRELLIARHGERPRVLILDDDEEFTRAVGAVLGERGMRVSALADPSRIIETLEEARPDALLLDVVLPGISGLDVCRMLRTTPRWQELPILILTAQSSVDNRMGAFQSGADDYLVKPLVDDELLARINVRVERSRLRRERLERDVLTGLLLRRAFLEGLQARMAESRRHNRPLSLCLIDLDHFKQVNDGHGHLAGDRVLTALGNLLGSRFRTEDLRGRWGGEEFILAFPGERAETIQSVVSRILDEYRLITFIGDHGEEFHSSFSAGIATFPEDGNTLEELLQIADRRLYAAKAAGRDRVTGR
jgi:diguanylate cyclase (GGDEF)-like protein